MKTRNVYVYILRFADGTLETMSFLSRAVAVRERAHDKTYLGVGVSPIVKVAVPIPEVPK